MTLSLDCIGLFAIELYFQHDGHRGRHSVVEPGRGFFCGPLQGQVGVVEQHAAQLGRCAGFAGPAFEGDADAPAVTGGALRGRLLSIYTVTSQVIPARISEAAGT